MFVCGFFLTLHRDLNGNECETETNRIIDNVIY